MDPNSKKVDSEQAHADLDPAREPHGYQHAHDGEDWDHRPHDHLVEPLFGGLGTENAAGEQRASDDSGTASSPVGWLAVGGILIVLLWWLNS